MINPLDSVGSISNLKTINRANAADEFEAVFYKEMLKQAFTVDESSNLGFALGKDIFIDQMAKELARKNKALAPLIENK